MKIERQFEELARIEFEGAEVEPRKANPYSVDSINYFVYRLPDSPWRRIPDYNSLDSLHRIIYGMDTPMLLEYVINLLVVMGMSCERMSEKKAWLEIRNHSLLALKATPAQVREAILRAYGKWEMEG